MFIEIDKLSIKRLIGQMIIARLNIEDYLQDQQYKENIFKLIKIGVGGFCLFQGNKVNTMKVIHELNEYAPIPLIFSGDYEHGLTMRLDDGTSFPHSMALGNSKYPNATYEVAKAISKEIKELGIHWNFAPVCDINSNIDNPIINIRAFGEDVETVNKNLIEYIKASEEEKVISCAKHFPGHGDTSIDSHLSLPAINKTLNQLRKLELKPFIEAIKCNVPSIMIAHIALPEIDESIPASLSSKVCNSLLRQELKYEGIIITDALEMKAIVDNYKCEEIAEMGLNADIDVFLMPENPIKLIESIQNLVSKNIDFEFKIKNSAQRILNLKEKYNVFDKLQLQNTFKINLDFPQLALETAISSLKISGDLNLIPINEETKITGIAILQDDNIEIPSTFFNMLTSAIENEISLGFIDKNVTNRDIDDLVRDTFLTDLFIFPIFIRSKAYQGSVGIHPNLIKAIREIKGFKPAIIIFFGNPYLEEKIEAELKILTYSDSLPSMAATVVKLSGREAGV
jgi:beta-N-acetylhexosaminidase